MAVSIFHTLGRDGSGTTAVLCLCALTHAYLLFSVFPYAGYFSVFLLSGGPTDQDQQEDGITVDNCGIYAGLLGSAFTLGRALGFVPWKAMRSSSGERSALLTSLLLSAIFSVIFGMSRSFTWALFWRFLLGLSNGISGAVKRAAIDRARVKTDGKDYEEEEEWAVATILSVMSWGCALGPAIGGWLADPFLLPNVLGPYPFLLPNLFGALLCVVSLVSVLMVVEGRDIRDEQKKNGPVVQDLMNQIHLAHRQEAPPSSLSETSALLPKTTAHHQKKGKPSAFSVIYHAKRTRSHFIAYWTFSFCVVCIDEALPLFLIAKLGGPGLSASQVGWISAASGIVTVVCQHSAVGQVMMEKWKIYPTLRLSALLGNVPSALLPISLILNGGTYAALALAGFQPGLGITGSSFAVLALLVGILRVFATIYFGLIGIATGRTVPLAYKDEASRIMTLGALASRAVAPTVAGGITTVFMSSGRPWALWTVIGLVFGTCTAALTYILREAAAAGWGGAQSGVAKRRRLYLSERQRAQVYAKLWEVHYDKGSSTVGAKFRKATRKAIAVVRIAAGALPAVEDDSGAAEMQGIGTEGKMRTSWADHKLTPGIDVDDVDFFIMGTQKFDTDCEPHVLTPPLMEALHKHLPVALGNSNFWLKYSLVRDGSSLWALESMVSLSKHTFLAIETLDGNVFGCFMTKPWERTNKYNWCQESFLWRLKKPRAMNSSLSPDEQATIEGDIEVFTWTGENDLCQLLANDKIAVGGGLVSGGDGDGFGFIIGNDLMAGSSSPCKTYGNPCLVSDAESGKFEVANIEIWAMTPFLFVADAERSERSARLVEEALVIHPSGQTPSSQMPWSNFL